MVFLSGKFTVAIYMQEFFRNDMSHQKRFMNSLNETKQNVTNNVIPNLLAQIISISECINNEREWEWAGMEMSWNGNELEWK